MMQFYLVAALVVLSVERQRLAQAFVLSSSSRAASPLHADRAVDDSSFARFEASLQPPEPSSKSETSPKKKLNWQADLERLLNPTTSISQRQVLLSELIEKNGEIRASVEKAMLDRNIDPLLTPTGRRLQDGTKAVARQITRDILPSLIPRPDSNTAAGFPNLQDVGKTNQRFLNVLQNQFQSNLETFQQDIADPSRIPDRLRRQSETVLQEAANIFAETPAGLAALPYTVVSQTDDYEVRDYPAHMAISTDLDATALARLTSYAVGANKEQRVTGWTVPITNTGTELRFAFLGENDVATAASTHAPPTPLEQDAVPEAHLMFDGGIRIAPIPAARLAVRRFTGFITAGEVARQKQKLLAALALDQIDLDIPHGTTVGHLVLEYNPPYTIPVVRRNEIAVPVLLEETDADDDA